MSSTAAPAQTRRRHPLLVGLGAVVAAALVIGGLLDAAASGGDEGVARSQLTLYAPAAAGGGWDSAARESQQALRDDRIVNSSQVANIPGAGGTIGLNQLVTQLRGDNTTLMMMGITMLGAIQVNGSDVSLDEVTPIARLTDDYDVVVVPADSPIQSMDQLVAEWQKDPKQFAFGGGSLGSVDQMIITRLATESGINAPDVEYIAYSGGGELATSLLSGTIKASVSGFADFEDQIEAGRLRALAVSAPEPVETIDLPTLKEEGYDVDLTNWRGVIAPPDITAEDRAELEDIVTEMHASPAWQDALERNGWTDTFLVGEDFEEYLSDQTEFVDGIWSELGY